MLSVRKSAICEGCFSVGAMGGCRDQVIFHLGGCSGGEVGCWSTFLYRCASRGGVLKSGPPTKTTICTVSRGRLRRCNQTKRNLQLAFQFVCGTGGGGASNLSACSLCLLLFAPDHYRERTPKRRPAPKPVVSTLRGFLTNPGALSLRRSSYAIAAPSLALFTNPTALRFSVGGQYVRGIAPIGRLGIFVS